MRLFNLLKKTKDKKQERNQEPSQAKTISLIEAINTYATKHNLNKNANFVIACSGGVDSMALCFLLKQAGFLNLTAVIIDHGIRKNSAKQAALAYNFNLKNGIKSIVIKTPHIDTSKNLEANARLARYNAILNYAKQNKAEAVFFAHHLNDQAETLLMRLERGSGLNGLCSMWDYSIMQGIKILRPLLEVQKNELINFCRLNKIQWQEDQSNLSKTIQRNALRAALGTVAKDDKLLIKRLGTSIAALQSDKLALDAYFEDLKQKIIITNPAAPRQIAIMLSSYLKLVPSMQFRLLCHILQSKTQESFSNQDEDADLQIDSGKAPRAEQIKNLHNFIVQNSKSWIYQVHGTKVLKQKTPDDFAIYFTSIDK